MTTPAQITRVILKAEKRISLCVECYARNIRWLNLVRGTDIPEEIECFWNLGRRDWPIVAGDITLRSLVEHYERDMELLHDLGEK